jgi:hypothetical protein
MSKTTNKFAPAPGVTILYGEILDKKQNLYK